MWILVLWVIVSVPVALLTGKILAAGSRFDREWAEARERAAAKRAA